MCLSSTFVPSLASFVFVVNALSTVIAQIIKTLCNIFGNETKFMPGKIDIKATLKAWRNRPPVISDDIGHWNDIFSWRQHYHQKIIDVGFSSDLFQIHSVKICDMISMI